MTGGVKYLYTTTHTPGQTLPLNLIKKTPYHFIFNGKIKYYKKTTEKKTMKINHLLKSIIPKSSLSWQQYAWTAVLSSLFYIGMISFSESELGKSFQYNIATNIELKTKEFLDKTPSLNKRIKIFSLGDQSIALLNRNHLFLHEWAHILDEISKQNPDKIIIDKIFGVANQSKQSKNIGVDKILSIPTPIITGAFISPAKIPQREPLDFSKALTQIEQKLNIGLKHLNPKLFAEDSQELVRPYELSNLIQETSSIAYARHKSLKKIFTLNGLFNYSGQLKFSPFVRVGDEFVFPHASILAATKLDINNDGHIEVNGEPIPINSDGLSIINLANKQEFYARIKPLINLKQFPTLINEGDIVLILPNMYTGSTDFHSSPVGYIPGGFFIASIINSVLNGQWIHQLRFPRLQMLFCSILGLYTALFLSSSIFWIMELILLILIIGGGIVSFAYFDLETSWWWGSLCFLGISIVLFTYKSIFFEKFKEINDEITDILDSIEQAIFTFNPDQSLNPEHSKMAGTMFNPDNFKKRDSIATVFEMSDKKLEEFSEWVKLLFNPKKLRRWKKLALLSPMQQFHTNGASGKKTIALDYKPVMRNGQLRKVMVLGTDITRKLEMESKIKQHQQENELKMERMRAFVSHDIDLIGSFLDEANILMKEYAKVESLDHLSEQIDEAYRDMHTLKGNSGSFGFLHLASIVDGAENFMSLIRSAKNDSKRNPDLNLESWNEKVGQIQAELSSIGNIKNTLFKGLEGKISVDKDQYEELMDKIRKNKVGMPEVLQSLQNFTNTRFGKLMEKYAQMISSYREKSGKDIADLIIHNPNQFVNKDHFSLFDNALIHLIRNAMDHGIEAPEVRAYYNKGPGRIEVCFNEHPEKDEIVIRDDGGGIDPDLIYRKALEKNLIKPDSVFSDQEKVNLICLPGFSTKAEANEISGRGVGMDAVSQLLKDLGGGLTIESEKNKGSIFYIHLPKKQVLKAS